MKIKHLRNISVLLLLAAMPFTAGAWGMLGHRIVGEIAYSYLSPKTRLAVRQLLGNESVAIASNWADFVRSDTSYSYLNTWHYINLPAGLTKNELNELLKDQSTPNIYNKLNEMIAVLKNPKSTVEKKKLALRLVIHMVGDLHQPMHTARKDDYGGNKIQVTWFGEQTNLHSVWDEKLVDFQQLSYTEYARAINFPSRQQLTAWQKTDLQTCIFESYEICNKIYAAGIKNNDKLSYRYNFDWIQTVNQQLLKGGIRLANVLNDVYG